MVDDATKELNARFVHEVISLVKPLYLRALQFTRNRTDAEDLLQGTCSRPRPESLIQHGTNLKAWLHRIMFDAYLNSYRKRQCGRVCVDGGLRPTHDVRPI